MSITEIFVIAIMLIMMGSVVLDYWHKDGALPLGIFLSIIVVIIWFFCTFGLAGPSEYFDGSITEGEYGYISNDIYYPGGTYMKFPWVNVIKYKSDYKNYVVNIPIQTNDGMRLLCMIDYVHVKFNPIAYRDVYDLNPKNLELMATKVAKPILNRYFMEINERDYETNQYPHREIIDTLKSELPTNGLLFEKGIPSKFAIQFIHLDNPKGDYFDYEKYGAYVNS